MSYVITSWDLVFLMVGWMFTGAVISGLSLGLWFTWKVAKLQVKIERLENH